MEGPYKSNGGQGIHISWISAQEPSGNTQQVNSVFDNQCSVFATPRQHNDRTLGINHLLQFDGYIDTKYIEITTFRQYNFHNIVCYRPFRHTFCK